MKIQDMRIDKFDKNLVDRDKEVYFYFNGKKIKAYYGEEIGVALWASGVRAIDRSIKYQRRRGLQTLRPMWEIVHVKVNGVPHINPATTLVKDSIIVEEQSGSHSFLRVFFERIDVSPVRYYIELAKPRTVRTLMTKLVNKVIGTPKPPESNVKRVKTKELQERKIDVLILGASFSGLKLAEELSDHDLKTVVVTPERFVGGAMYYRLTDKEKSDVLYPLVQKLEEKENLEIKKQIKLIGLHEEKSTVVLEKTGEGYRYIVYKPKIVVVAFDPVERIPSFYNNDLPGVIFADMAYRLVNIYGVKPGNDIVILGAGTTGVDLAKRLNDLSLNVEAIIDKGNVKEDTRKKLGFTRVYDKTTIHGAIGEEEIRGVKISKVGATGQIEEPFDTLYCDTLIIATGYRPFFELPSQLKPKLVYIEPAESFAPIRNELFETSIDGLFVIGDLVDFSIPRTSEIVAELASIGILEKLGFEKNGLVGRKDELINELFHLLKGSWLYHAYKIVIR